MSGATHIERATRRAVLRLLALGGLAALPVVARQALEVSAVALFKDRAVLRIDGRQRTLRSGESSPEGVRLLAADAARARILVDGEERELALGSGAPAGRILASARTVVRLVPDRSGHYFVDGQINGNPVRFLVDTGATAVAMNKHMARRMGLAYAVDGVKGTVQTASGIVVAYAITLNEVKVQALALVRVRGAVIDGDYPSEPLLGQSFLNRLDLHRAGPVLELHAR